MQQRRRQLLNELRNLPPTQAQGVLSDALQQGRYEGWASRYHERTGQPGPDNSRYTICSPAEQQLRNETQRENEREQPHQAETDLDRAKAWAKAHDLDMYRGYEADQTHAESAGARASADQGLVHHWKRSTDYDTQRPARDAELAPSM